MMVLIAGLMIVWMVRGKGSLFLVSGPPVFDLFSMFQFFGSKRVRGCRWGREGGGVRSSSLIGFQLALTCISAG